MEDILRVRLTLDDIYNIMCCQSQPERVELPMSGTNTVRLGGVSWPNNSSLESTYQFIPPFTIIPLSDQLETVCHTFGYWGEDVFNGSGRASFGWTRSAYPLF
jgi:hypothetical protein